MRKVSTVGLPSVERIVDSLPRTIKNDKPKLKLYLEELDKKYKEKICEKLYEIDIKDLDKPIIFNPDNVTNWYNNYIRKEDNEVFVDFPTIKNVNSAGICPICEGVFSTKVTLEHIIPKGKHGDYRFAILPINLIKCCEECNTSKHQKKSDNKDNSEINPYEEDFRIEDYLEVYLEEKNGVIIPSVKFSFSQTCFDKRIKNFIDIYNIEKTYNHRVKLEYQKIISTLSNKPDVYRRALLYNYITNLKESYQSNMEYEKIEDYFWIDQNYFGFKLCENLVNFSHNQQYILDCFISEINQHRHSPNDLVLENNNFFKEFESVTDKDNFLNFVLTNEKDLEIYYNHLKNHGIDLEFPNLDIDKISKNMIEAILKYYIESKKGFDSFKQNIFKILN